MYSYFMILFENSIKIDPILNDWLVLSICSENSLPEKMMNFVVAMFMILFIIKLMHFSDLMTIMRNNLISKKWKNFSPQNIAGGKINYRRTRATRIERSILMSTPKIISYIWNSRCKKWLTMETRMLDFWGALISKDKNTKAIIDFMRSNSWQSRN